jgi:hypothetical protein
MMCVLLSFWCILLGDSLNNQSGKREVLHGPGGGEPDDGAAAAQLPEAALGGSLQELQVQVAAEDGADPGQEGGGGGGQAAGGRGGSGSGREEA